MNNMTFRDFLNEVYEHGKFESFIMDIFADDEINHHSFVQYECDNETYPVSHYIIKLGEKYVSDYIKNKLFWDCTLDDYMKIRFNEEKHENVRFLKYTDEPLRSPFKNFENNQKSTCNDD